VKSSEFEGIWGMKESILREKSYKFAIRIVKLSQYLQSEKKEYVLSKQVLESGTAIGALIREAQFGQSKADFASKMNIALKEANETDYWLCLLKDTKYIDEKMFKSLQSDCLELAAMLISSVKTCRKALSSEK
jgi:four helix bundle protein